MIMHLLHTSRDDNRHNMQSRESLLPSGASWAGAVASSPVPCANRFDLLGADSDGGQNERQFIEYVSGLTKRRRREQSA